MQAQAEQIQAEQAQAEQIQAEQIQAEQIQVEQTPAKLPYRTINKDIYNKMYADVLKKNFQNLTSHIQVDFEKFTQNLMEEEYISRNHLLDAIDDFYKINFRLCDADYNWSRYTDNAFNYRPYQ
jgi:hypothetical protein